MRWSYRNRPVFILRRLDRAAAHVNIFLLIAALSLAALDTLYAAKRIATDMPRHPVAVQAAAATTP